ncbi:DUF4830 domain-containing protein [Bacillus sp. FJAT-28004]|uniref:DUF4830 domain-containing protein n=1 Tax=Bacillus sp. FJAT-28004 TaxID=1679165 RepID=UPI0006B582CD|nr:DUF4830 domain-containing protein [Bacillus sp. FJAT-28004]
MKYLFILALLSFSIGCSEQSHAPTEQAVSQSYLEKKGYQVVEKGGQVSSYELTEKKLSVLPYMMYWGLQSVDPSDYVGKTIHIQKFIVTNHPLLEENVDVYVYLADGQPIGGTSFPNGDISDGGYWSIDGKTLEEVQGKSFQDWREVWAKKYTPTSQN